MVQVADTWAAAQRVVDLIHDEMQARGRLEFDYPMMVEQQAEPEAVGSIAADLSEAERK